VLGVRRDSPESADPGPVMEYVTIPRLKANPPTRSDARLKCYHSRLASALFDGGICAFGIVAAQSQGQDRPPPVTNSPIRIRFPGDGKERIPAPGSSTQDHILGEWMLRSKVRDLWTGPALFWVQNVAET
jgi:hypothetical protein